MNSNQKFIHRSTNRCIDPRDMRRELSNLFRPDNKFQMNKMDDPVEVLFAFLNSFHSYAVDAKSLKYIMEKPCNPNCLAHNYFWINLLEQNECECGATSEVLQWDYNYFIYEAYVKEILNMVIKKDSKEYARHFFDYVKILNVNKNII